MALIILQLTVGHKGDDSRLKASMPWKTLHMVMLQRPGNEQATAHYYTEETGRHCRPSHSFAKKCERVPLKRTLRRLRLLHTSQVLPC